MLFGSRIIMMGLSNRQKALLFVREEREYEEKKNLQQPTIGRLSETRKNHQLDER
jgi:hypothetical protein